MTHNEPWVAAFVGHLEGAHAPGIKDWGAALPALHHVLLSHGRAVPVIRANSPGANVGIALDCRPSFPASDDPADIGASRHFDGFRNRWIFDPVFDMGYPEDMVEAYTARGRFPDSGPGYIEAGDMDAIATPIDFVGINYYTSLPITAGRDESEETDVAPGPNPPEGYTEMGWPITPDALTDFLQRVHARYGPKSILITENGASFSDGPGPSGRIDDTRRVAYLQSHTAALGRAVASGVPVDGYFAWSLLDNFEWSQGYQQRFGLVHVDFETLERTPKASYDWYRALIAED
jgi:beta-glucosidase